MKLTHNTMITTYEVESHYTVITRKSPLISVLKVASEKAPFTLKNLQDLLKPLNSRAIKNLVERLENLEYFQKNEDEIDMYILTEKGKKVCDKDEIEEEKSGILEIEIATSQDIPPTIVKITPNDKTKNRIQPDKQKKDGRQFFKKFINGTSLNLKNGTFKLLKIEDVYSVEKEQKGMYNYTFDKTQCKIELLDYRDTFEIDKKDTINELLYNKYGEDFDTQQQLIYMPYSSKSLQLKRKIDIETPLFKGVNFNKHTLEDKIQISPVSDEDARQWFLNLLISRISNHFYSEEEFKKFTDTIANEFVEYKDDLRSLISSRAELIETMNESHYFYKKAKLDTSIQLTY